ncbi:MAG TPA: hypothetical protein DHV79_10985 [Lachnospiraceae bacterium]|nr:hypothetical protein [Lachnospiraceae bacterium]
MDKGIVHPGFFMETAAHHECGARDDGGVAELSLDAGIGSAMGTVMQVFRFSFPFITKCTCNLEIFMLKLLTSCYIFTGLTQVGFIVVTI